MDQHDLTENERGEVLRDLAVLGVVLDELRQVEPVSPEAAARRQQTVARVEGEKRRLELLLLDAPSSVRALPSRGGSFETAAEVMEREG